MDFSFFGFLSVFLSGLLLNLTPCVFPMVSVTAALFTGTEKKRSFLKAAFYFFGIVLTYSFLGTFAALTGNFFGATLQNPWVLGVISALMFALGLALFGIYDFRFPSFLLDWAGKKKVGLIGIFLSGAVVGVIAAPCMGPPLVALVILVSQTANPLLGFFWFFVFSSGLGLPYLVLGARFDLVSKIPKSGEWLVWVKKLFGTILFGFGLFYLALASFNSFLPYVVPVTVFSGAIYLGFFEPNGNKTNAFRIFKRTAGTLAILAVTLAALFLPREGVVWEKYEPERLNFARQTGKPVVIDFYADWCFPCHELDQFTYSDEKVIEALEPFVRLKVDVTNPNSPQLWEPIDRFDVIGVPTILFLDKTGKEVKNTRFIGYVPPEVFLESVYLVEKDESAPKTD